MPAHKLPQFTSNRLYERTGTLKNKIRVSMTSSPGQVRRHDLGISEGLKSCIIQMPKVVIVLGHLCGFPGTQVSTVSDTKTSFLFLPLQADHLSHSSSELTVEPPPIKDSPRKGPSLGLAVSFITPEIHLSISQLKPPLQGFFFFFFFFQGQPTNSMGSEHLKTTRSCMDTPMNMYS